MRTRLTPQTSSDYKNGARVYGVYYNYEADYSVLAGTDKCPELHLGSVEKMTLATGAYLVFTAQGTAPQVVINT